MEKLMKCNTCNNEISVRAKSCPNCGDRNKKTLGKKLCFITISFIIVSILVFIGSFDNESNEEKFFKKLDEYVEDTNKNWKSYNEYKILDGKDGKKRITFVQEVSMIGYNVN